MSSGVRIILFAASAAALLFGQGGQPRANPGGGPTTGNPGNNTPPGSIPGPPGNNRPGRPGDTFPQDRFPQMDRQMPIFLSGKVTLEDGTPPPESVNIERVCNGGQPRLEAHTDSKGRFSFQLGNSMNVMQDASVSSSDDISDITGGSRRGSSPQFPGQQRGFSERELMGCELRAALPGYRSQVVSLAGRRALENPDVGTIILRRLGNVEGLTTSITSLEAPKDAKKAYEKGKKAVEKKKDDEAQRELQKAVELYPRYAAAWFELGGTYERAQNVEEARKAYAKALEADGRFVNPYMQLAGIAAREQKWQEVDDTTDRVLKLNPYDFPAAYLYNAFANLNMQKLDEAEKSAREGLKQDEMHRFPKLEHLLAIVLAQKNDLPGAAEHFKAYLKFAPGAKDAESVRNQLAEVEKQTAAKAAEPKP